MDNNRRTQSSGGNRPGVGNANNQGQHSSSGGGPHFNVLEWVVGIRVRVTTLLESTVTGQIHAYDPITSSLTILTGSEHNPGGPYGVRILRIAFLKEVTVLAPAPRDRKPGYANAEPKIAYVNPAVIAAREREAMKQERDRQTRKGNGVSKEAQDIFDALNRTMNCRWHEKQIVVLETVMIREPYGINDVKSNDPKALQRVKTVLEGERKKLEGRRTTTPPVSGERKGG